MSQASAVSLGIDVAKATFEAALLVDGKVLQRSFAMTVPGFDALHAWMRQQEVKQAHACLEATGEYGAALALRLYAVGHVVSIVNPARIAAYAKSRLARTKTDKADATLIAHFCRTQQPLPWTPPPAEVRELQARVRRVEMLQEMAQQEVNRLHSGLHRGLHSGLHSPSVRDSREGPLAFLRQEIAKMQRLVQEQVEPSADRQYKQRLLCSIPGSGRWTAARALDGGAGAGRKRAGAHLGERAPPRRLCGLNPARTHLGHLRTAPSAACQDGQEPFASRALPASDRGDATPSGDTRLG